MGHPTTPPRHGELGPLARAIEVASLLSAAGLVVLHSVRLARATDPFTWWTPLVIVAAIVAADFLSGLVHWAADTWGSETMPFFGPRFIRPFRVHHVNPDDFLDRSFVDANGDVAMLVLPALLFALTIPLDSTGGRLLATFIVALAVSSLPTNQAHQWAHRGAAGVPRAVTWLQRIGLLLGPREHARHHQSPHTANYGILTGWCNRPLAAIGFFPALERAITGVTGIRPRVDADEDEGAASRTPMGVTGS